MSAERPEGPYTRSLVAGEVLAGVEAGIGWILLNRPKALNALTLEQIHALDTLLREWARDDTVGAVVVEGAGEKGFCAGGDIRRLYEASLAGDDAYLTTFFRDEYRLDRLTRVYPKPYISLLDGIVMGGGVGISLHGRYRVATDRTVFAMPETGIGFFPDVGGTHALPRCPGEAGLYLGLTGERLRAADCLWAGVATHYVPTDRLDALKAALAQSGGAPEAVAEVLDGFAAQPGPAPLAAHQEAIDRVFAADSLMEIVAALAADGGEWAEKTLAHLRRRSPLALAVTFRQLRAGRDLGFDDALKLEYRLSQRMVRGDDFKEGVRATIVDKDNAPRWQPASLEAVTEATVEAVFAPLAPEQELTFEEVA